MTIPAISALIDTYNQAHFLEQALASVFEQDISPSEMEIIVVDDGSTDDTASIIRKFGARVLYLRKENGGQASAFNAAIPKTSAPIVAFLDADDWWAPGKLRAVLDAFDKNPTIAAVGHGFFEVRGSAPPAEYLVPEKSCHLDLSSIDAVSTALAGCIFLGTSRLAVRRAVLDQIGPIPEELVFCADMPILTLAFALGGAVLLDKPLCYYRLHSENLFKFGPDDIAKARRKNEIVRCHLNILPQRLAEVGVPPEVIAAFFAGNALELEHFRLRYDKASRIDNFRAQRKTFLVDYKNATPGYKAFKWLVCLATLLVSPRRFYQVRDWYARKNFSRARKLVGDAEPVESQTFIHRRQIAVPNGLPK